MPKDYGPGPHVAVDAIVLAYTAIDDYLLTITRQDGSLALPGGFVDPTDASLEEAAKREVLEETGLDLGKIRGASQNARTKKDRDPRSWVISFPFTFHLGQSTFLPSVKGMDDAKGAMWMPVGEVRTQKWFLDHLEILKSTCLF